MAFSLQFSSTQLYKINIYSWLYVIWDDGYIHDPVKSELVACLFLLLILLATTVAHQSPEFDVVLTKVADQSPEFDVVLIHDPVNVSISKHLLTPLVSG
jgi:hypothetical protein